MAGLTKRYQSGILERNGSVSSCDGLYSYVTAEEAAWPVIQEVAMTVEKVRTWIRVLPAVVALALLSGCVVYPAYAPYSRGYYGQGYYGQGYYGQGQGYYPYYRDDYYYRRY